MSPREETVERAHEEAAGVQMRRAAAPWDRGEGSGDREHQQDSTLPSRATGSPCYLLFWIRRQLSVGIKEGWFMVLLATQLNNGLR